MNTEEDEFRRIELEAKRRAQAAEDDDTQEYVAQRTWVGLTDGDWEWVADKKETSLDTFAHGAAWAADRLKEKNNG